MALIWEKSGDGFSATVSDRDGATRFHLSVEADGVWWNWAVRRSGEDRAMERGRTVTRHGAMWDAERVGGLSNHH
jgi:hypothetical protein